MLEFDTRRQAVGRRVLGIGGDNNGAGFRKERGDGEANALRGAGDESNFAVETIHVGFLRFRVFLIVAIDYRGHAAAGHSDATSIHRFSRPDSLTASMVR